MDQEKTESEKLAKAAKKAKSEEKKAKATEESVNDKSS